MSESTSLLEKGILPTEAEAADDRQKRACQKKWNKVLIMSHILFPLNIAVGILSMHVIAPVLAAQVDNVPSGNITRWGLCGMNGDGNLKINIPGPACAFTAGAVVRVSS